MDDTDTRLWCRECDVQFTGAQFAGCPVSDDHSVSECVVSER